jgi:NAD(P)-dependent dehydrogenase (short-subunit alcohol dehydrogenase family)
MNTASADFRDRHVVVTGAAGALGGVIVARLRQAGAICHLPLRAATSRFHDDDRLRVGHGIDLCDERAVNGFYEAIPGPWASIHAAGGFAYGPVAETGKDVLAAQIDMNFVSCVLCCRAAVVAIKRGGGGGRIVNVTARPGLEWARGANMAAYTATKAAVAAFTVALAGEVTAEGILVNAVAPSIIDTPANRRDMPDADFSKWPKADDIATRILALASPENTGASGEIHPIYGGL